METIVTQHKANFDTLSRAFKRGDVAIMDCVENATGEHVAVICAVIFDANTKEYVMTPFARFFNGNPYELLTPPQS